MAVLKEKGNFMIEKTVQRAFDQIITERLNEVVFRKVRANLEYREANTRALELFDKLMNSLQTEEQKELLYDLEEAWNLAESYFIEYSYRQGLEDSPMIHREFNKALGISVAEVSEIQGKN
jgi:hypothetical protein